MRANPIPDPARGRVARRADLGWPTGNGLAPSVWQLMSALNHPG